MVVSYLRFGTAYRKTDRLSRNMLAKILKIKTHHKIEIHFLVSTHFTYLHLLYLSSPYRVVILLFSVTVQVSVFTSRTVRYT